MKTTKSLMLAIFVGFLGSASSIAAKSTYQKLSLLQAQRLSNLSISALQHVDEARQLLASSKTGEAKAALQKGMSIIETVRKELPTVSVKTQISQAAAKLDRQSNVFVRDDLETLYAFLDEIDDFVDVAKVRSHFEKAGKLAKSDQAQKAQKELQAAQVLVVYGQVEMSLLRLQTSIANATSEINKNQIAAAKKTLKSSHNPAEYSAAAFFEPRMVTKKASH
jgi:hypothetical protein